MRLVQIFFLVIGFIAFSQEKTNSVIVDYDEITDFGILSKTYSTLTANNWIAYYERKFIEYNNTQHDAIVRDYNNELNQHSKQYFFSNFNNGSIHFIDESIDQSKIFIDSITSIEWIIDDMEYDDTILGFNYKTAKGLFRGREYKAWFTTVIPIRYGPWKLHGLPGLILKVKDSFEQIEIIASKIKFTNNKPKRINLDKTEKIFDIKFYQSLLVEEEEKSFNEVINKVQSKMPRGSAINNINLVDNKNFQFEIEFEWEKDNKD